MITANNGILIVAMLFAWGVHTGDKWLVLMSIISASAAWLANVASERITDAGKSVFIVTALVAAAASAVGVVRMVITL